MSTSEVGRPRRRRRAFVAGTVALLLGVSTAVGVGLSGITGGGTTGVGGSDVGGSGADGSGQAPGASPSPTGALAASTLVPVIPDPLTVDAVKAETTRVADLMVGFIDSGEGGIGNLLNDDAAEEIVPANGAAASVFGVLRTLTLDPSVDAAQQAESLRSALVAGGWIERKISNTQTGYVAVLSSSAEPSEAWFLQLGADLSVPGESVIALQLLSPNLP